MMKAALTAALAALTGAASAEAAEVRLTAAIGNEIVQLVEAAPSVTQVVVNERVVFEDRENHGIAFVNAYNMQGRWLVLLREDADGACPTRYRVLDLGGPRASVSLPFGTCRNASDVAAAGNVLTVSMPVGESRETAAWTYNDGLLLRIR